MKQILAAAFLATMGLSATTSNATEERAISLPPKVASIALPFPEAMAAAETVPLFTLHDEAVTAKAAVFAAKKTGGGVVALGRTNPGELICLDYEEANFCSGWEPWGPGGSFGFYCYPGNDPANCLPQCAQNPLPYGNWRYLAQVISNNCTFPVSGGGNNYPHGYPVGYGVVNPEVDFAGPGTGTFYLDSCTAVISPYTAWAYEPGGDPGCYGWWYSPNDTGGGSTPPASTEWLVQWPSTAPNGSLCTTVWSFFPLGPG